ncbi:MAG: helix-turn-helix transcriptional regulator [Agathobacter sp.]|nr:helix-turn-helix transcriptional regulator [Agathobacter sp.]
MSENGMLELEQENLRDNKHTYLHDGGNFSSDMINTPLCSDEFMQQFYDGIVSNILIEMDKQAMSCRGLAAMTGVTVPHISRILASKARPGLEVLVKIAYALKVSPSDLLPCDINKRKSPGERYDEITKELDVKSNNFLLNYCAEFVKLYRGIKYDKRG